MNAWARARRRAVAALVGIDDEAGALRAPGPPDRRAAVVLLTTAAVLIGLHYVVLSGDFQRFWADRLVGEWDRLHTHASRAFDDRYELAELLGWSAGCIVAYLLIPAAVIRWILKEPLSAYGLTAKGFRRHLPIYALLFAPVALAVALVSGTPSFLETYPFYPRPPGWLWLLAWELSYAVQFLALEFFFRGFMLHGLKARYGTAALWIMLFPYCMIHFPKPLPETLGALVAGAALGVLSLRTGSVVGGAAIHVAVAWWMDLLALWRKGDLDRLFGG